ncbi:MAG: hypothetical protein VX642_01835 [Bdellovibrionota bacterium]|nr:hypothetical protein [Bdellovibrionota bacterium]
MEGIILLIIVAVVALKSPDADKKITDESMKETIERKLERNPTSTGKINTGDKS